MTLQGGFGGGGGWGVYVIAGVIFLLQVLYINRPDKK